jgi:predicted P-loop ATPase
MVIIENYLNQKYQFRYNEITSRTYFKEKEQEEFKLLKQINLNSIKRELNNNQVSCSISDLKCLLESNYVQIYNPFKEYFNSLPNWDGEIDYINQLSDTIHTDDNDNFKWAFKKWIVAMVACSIFENETNQAVLIFTGGQGIGKTTWMSKLVPDSLKEYFYSGIINPGNKDHNLLLSERLIINLDELASFNKNQIEAFKEMVTKQFISERRAYGHFTEDYIRRASFVGSSNHKQILTDVTGNRRFLCFEVKSIQREHQVDLNLVYAQAMNLIIGGNFNYHFDLEDIKRIEQNNQNFIQASEVDEIINEYFKIPSVDDEIHYLSATEIYNFIKKNGGQYSKINVVEIGKIITAKGFQTKKIKGSSKYIIAYN